LVAPNIGDTVNGLLIIAAYLSVPLLLFILLIFIAGKLDDYWSEKTLKEINRSILGIAVALIIPVVVL